MFCEKCGNEIKEGEQFCSKCGTKVDLEKENSNNNFIKNIQNKIKWKNLLIISLCVLVVSLILRFTLNVPSIILAFITIILGLSAISFIFSIVLGIISMKKEKTKAPIIILVIVIMLVTVFIAICINKTKEQEINSAVAKISNKVVFETARLDRNIDFDVETEIESKVIVIKYIASNDYTKRTYGNPIITVELSKKDYTVSTFYGNSEIEKALRNRLE